MIATERAAARDAEHGHTLSTPPPAGERVVRDLHQRMTIRLSDTCGGRLRVAVCGEVDYGRAETLHHVLHDGLRQGARGLDLDLSDVSFFDCSGLSALLRLRQKARELDVPLRLVRPSAAVVRVLELTGADATLAGPPSADARTGPSESS